MRLPSIKIQLIVFLVLFVLYLAFADKEPLFLFTTSIAVVCSVVSESLFVYFKEKKFRVTDSSVISGLIIGFVLSADERLWMFGLASFFAIASKHLLRIKGKHLFNPAAFGLLSVIILFGSQTQWKGTYLWYILVPAGVYFSYKIRKAPVLFGYGLTALLLFGTQAIIHRSALLGIFGYLSYFYIFVMVVEPKTSPVKPLGKLIFGVGVSALIFILTESAVKFDAELCALLILNAFVPLLNKVT